MANTLEKLAEHLPYTDGSFRRRLITGVIFIALSMFYSLLFVWNVSQLQQFSQMLATINVSSLIKSTQMMLIVALFVYALGALIDVISDGFIVRGVAAVSLVLGKLAEWCPRQMPSSVAWIVVVVVTISFWPVMLVLGIIASTCVYIRYTNGLKLGLDPTTTTENVVTHMREPLSNEARTYYD
jgi:hypothetical protein